MWRRGRPFQKDGRWASLQLASEEGLEGAEGAHHGELRGENILSRGKLPGKGLFEGQQSLASLKW